MVEKSWNEKKLTELCQKRFSFGNFYNFLFLKKYIEKQEIKIIDERDKKNIEIFKISQVFDRLVTAIFSQKSIKTWSKNSIMKKKNHDRNFVTA